MKRVCYPPKHPQGCMRKHPVVFATGKLTEELTMPTIFTTIRPATNTRGARITARATGRIFTTSVAISHKTERCLDEHDQAALELAKKIGVDFDQCYRVELELGKCAYVYRNKISACGDGEQGGAL